MKRKQFKRNIQSSRQRRGVTYMNKYSYAVYKNREHLKNFVGGFCIGLFFIVVLGIGYNIF